MTAPKVPGKWRPPLALVVYAVLLTVMAMPFLIVVWFRAIELSALSLTPADIGALVTVLLLTLVIGYVLVRAIAAPIDALIRRTDEIARRGPEAIRPIDSHGTREIARLSQSFLNLASELVDRTAYIRTFAAHVSHELKSPLTAIAGAAELLSEEEGSNLMTPEQRRHFLDNIVADAGRLDRLLVRLRDLAHAELPSAPGQTCMAAVLPATTHRFPRLAITCDANAGGMFALPLEVAGIVIANLAENAAQHGATALEISVCIERTIVSIRVKDNGSGIAPDHSLLVFQPFFSTRREQGGTGLGLDIVRALLAAHQAEIMLVPNAGAGATFEIRIPS